MITIALEIVGYWIGLGVFMWVFMFGALLFARSCEFAVDRLFR